MEDHIIEPEAGYETDDVLLKQEWSSISAPSSVSENDSSCFECNICFDSAHDPVVTLCGHLYCWPCIYKWFHVQISSLDGYEQQQSCPVCKASISVTSLVPLYGRGISSETKSKKPKLGVDLPGRPRPSLLNTSVTSGTTSTRHPTPQLHSDFFQSPAASFPEPQDFSQPYSGHSAVASSSLGGMATVSFFNPLMGMLGGLTSERIFGGSSTSLFTYMPHPFLVSNSPRIRRQEMELDKSLNRVSIFLFCCLILCLLLFGSFYSNYGFYSLML